MATATLIEEGVELGSKGLVFLIKYAFDNFRTQPLLDKTCAVLGKSRNLLEEVDGNAMVKALEADYSDDEDSHGEVKHLIRKQELRVQLNQLKYERSKLREDYNHFLLEKKAHYYKNLPKARKLWSRAEDLHRKTMAFSEGVQDMIVDVKFQELLSEKRKLNGSQLPISASELQEYPKHDQLTVQHSKEKAAHPAGENSVSEVVHEAPLAAEKIAQNLILAPLTINLIQILACPYCSTLSFNSQPELIVHLGEVHGAKNNKTTEDLRLESV